MYSYMDAYSNIISVIYFVITVLVTANLLVDLFVVVVSEKYSQIQSSSDNEEFL